jgi:predicted permease
MLQDLRFAVRLLRKNLAFSLAALITLALGIGANTAVFTAVNSVVFRSMVVERSEELVSLNMKGRSETPTFSYPDYRDLRDRNQVLTGLIAYGFDAISLSQGPGNNKILWSYLVTGNYFDVLGVRPFLGRLLHAEDDVKRGGHPVVVLSYACWQNRFGSDPNVTGRHVKLDGYDYTVVGVAPRGFYGTERIYTPELWVPMAMQPQVEPGAWLDERGDHNIFVAGRRKAGVTQATAQAALNVVAQQLGKEYPNTDAGLAIVLCPPGLAGNFLRGPIIGFSGVLMAVAGMVLLIACVNLAGLLLARAADRRKEIAVRLALGASRLRLIRQMLMESTLLSLAGGVAGLLLAQWITDLLVAWRPPVNVPVFPPLTLDVRVLIFTMGVSMLAGLLFGLAPAWQATGGDLTPALKNETPVTRFRRWHARDMLVAAQVGLSVVLLVGSTLMVRSLTHALSLNLGFEPRHAASISFDSQLHGYNDKRSLDLQRRLLGKVRALPGIESAGIIDDLPLNLHFQDSHIYVEGQPVLAPSETPSATHFRITPGFLPTFRTRQLSGRDFDDRDTTESKAVAIVNEAFAQQILHSGQHSGQTGAVSDAIGRRFRSGDKNNPLIEIVGVVETGKYQALGEQPLPAVFRPIYQSSNTDTSVVARSSLPEGQVVEMLKRALEELDPEIALYQQGSMTEQLGLALFPARLAASVLGAFGVLAIVLAGTGVYGMMAYTVARRSREIGIRMALGARHQHVMSAVLGRGALLLGGGVLGGVVLSLVAGRLLTAMLYGVNAMDALAYSAALSMIALVAFAACWFPARRAAHVDPATVLRAE